MAEIKSVLTLNLVSGAYQMVVGLAYADLSCYYDRMVRAVDFVVSGPDGVRGVADLRAKFAVAHIAPTASTLAPSDVQPAGAIAEK
ncbi:MAG: hypothetical protein RMN25_13165 [Anaerolineae bacterium]|nr:hypothetical protein [Thermoflexales bacterium]MDW8408723.1 hypothetical protein [Anaerolineae bacterium]